MRCVRDAREVFTVAEGLTIQRLVRQPVEQQVRDAPIDGLGVAFPFILKSERVPEVNIDMIPFSPGKHQQRCDMEVRFQSSGEIRCFLEGVAGIVFAVEVEKQLLEARYMVTVTVRIDREIT